MDGPPATRPPDKPYIPSPIPRPPSPPRTPEIKASPPGKRRSIVQNIKASFSRASLIRTVSSSTIPERTPSPVSHSQRNPRHTYEAQPSAYWTGRFTSLSDAHLSRATATLSFTPRETPPSSPVDNRGPQEGRLSRLFNRVDAGMVEAALDEGERARAVFEELEGLCKSGEARRSLWEWREGWAGKIGRMGVLPGRRGFLERLRFGRE